MGDISMKDRRLPFIVVDLTKLNEYKYKSLNTTMVRKPSIIQLNV